MRDARLGVPAHVTLLYPFLEPTALKGRIRRTIASIAAAHPSFQFELSGPREWPDTVYAAVHPEDRFLAIHRELAAAFPDYPIYSRPGFELIPHVTIAESEHVGNAAPLGHPAWSTLPAKGSVDGLEVIAEGEDGRWRTRLTVPLAVRRPA